MSRAQKYGMGFNDYVASANQSVAIIPQIEHREGVENIEEIVLVPGISAIFIGPYDLSGSLGKLGETGDPQVRKNIVIAKDACAQSGLPVGIFCMDTEAASSSIEQGFTLISVGMDILFVERSAQDTLRKLRK
jgi:2-keto-3-deoxy-L-rhamnonate aldolase RhmA